jgi:FlaA1/EpsC-like NDP-sugar epimerase
MSFNILIVGAGEAGQELALELARIPNGPRIAGFIDDDLSKKNRLIHSIPVLGTVAELDRLIHDHKVQEVVVSAPSAAGELVRRVIAACRQSKVRFRIVPRLVEIIEGHVHW